MPWSAKVWTPTGRLAGGVGNALVQSATWRVSTRIDTAIVSLPLEDTVGRLLRDTPGLLVSMEYRGLRWCGIVTTTTTTWSPTEATRTFYLSGPWDMLGGQPCYPVPTQPATNQSAAERDNRTGPLESVVKAYAAPIVTRLGLPVRILPTRGRGPTVSLSARFTTLTELVQEAVDGAGMQVTTRWWLPGDPQPGGGPDLTTPTVVLDVEPLSDVPGMVFTPMTGLVSAETTTRRPTATRVVVAGPGEGTARVNRVIRNVAEEGRLGPSGIRETYVDARNVDDDANIAAQMDRQGRDDLAEAAATQTVRIELAESTWQLSADGGPTSYTHGTRVRVSAGDDLRIDDIVRAVTVTCSQESPNPTVAGIEVGEVVLTLAQATARKTDALTASINRLSKER